MGTAEANYLFLKALVLLPLVVYILSVVPGQRIIRLNLPLILLLLFGLYVQGVEMKILPEPSFILPIAWLLVPIGTPLLFMQGVIWLVWAIKRFF